MNKIIELGTLFRINYVFVAMETVNFIAQNLPVSCLAICNNFALLR